MKKSYQITQDGKKELERELQELKARRSVIAQKIADARDFGDLSENAEWDAARDEQAQVETRISEIEDILMHSAIIKAKNVTNVEVGNTVVLKAKNTGKNVEYTIVGSVEADPLEGKISDESPIGRALLGQKVGAEVSIKTPGGEAGYIVEEIR